MNIIVAVDRNLGIGINGKLPWPKNIEDMARFRAKTLNSIVIMGRKTYESIGKPLDKRINIVVSKTLPECETIHVCRTLERAKELAFSLAMIEKLPIFIIGGRAIYDYFLANQLVDKILMTRTEQVFECDTYFPEIIPSDWTVTVDGTLHTYSKINFEETACLDIIREIVHCGQDVPDRTGIGTLSIFGKRLEFSLLDGRFPLMTTRKIFLRGVFEELMMFIRGQTNNQVLIDKNIHVWTPNTSQEAMNKLGLKLAVNDMGPTYGFLMRHFGAKYIDCNTDYKGQGVDQLEILINGLKNNPHGRRHIINLWDPATILTSALPPCLYNYQFYVENGYLLCMMTQRSSDFAVAGGWNIATGALLTYLIASVVGLKPKKLVWNLGDVHIYKNNILAAKSQLDRSPVCFPRLNLQNRSRIEDYRYSDLILQNYNPGPEIKFILNA